MKVERLSWSAHDTISHKCGQQYVFEKIEGIVRPPGFAIVRGKSIHKPVEENLKAKLETGALLPEDQVAQIASDAVDAATSGEMMLDGDYCDMTLAQARGVVKDEVVNLSLLHARVLAPAIEPSGIELKVEIPPSEPLPVTWVGVLDVIDGRRIRDTKTKRKAPPKTLADDSDQLTSYDMLYRAYYGEEPDGLCLDVLWQTPAKKESKHDTQATLRTEADILAFVNRVNATIRAIEAEVFLPAATDHWVCTPKFCGYTDICPYYRGRPRPTT